MMARSVATDRPFLITYLMMAITLWILERRRPLWLLPPLFIFWANAHGGYFMGWVLLGGYCGEALWLRLQKRPPADEKTLWMASIVGDPGERDQSHVLQRGAWNVRLSPESAAAHR